MAQEVDDMEFWLPSEFLTDDDFKTDRLNARRSDDFSCGFGNSFGFSSDLSSPVESVTGTTETDSDEDDFITELSRKVARSTIQNLDFSSDYRSKGWKLSGSPQSTLSGFKLSSKLCHNAVAGVYSPPRGKEMPGRDLLHAAAEEAAKIRMMEETTAFYSAKLFEPPPKPGPVSLSLKNSNPAIAFHPNKTQTPNQFSYKQFQAAKFQQMKQQQVMKTGAWDQGITEYNRRSGRSNGGAGGGRPQALSISAWPTLQQSQQPQHGSRMRAVFLGKTGPKKERTGTGVFMPRPCGSNPNTETRKKPAGCSTVLIPDRVAHALNLELDSIDTQLQLHPRRFSTEYDVALSQRNYATMAQQRSNRRPEPVINQELGLPQEWTY